MQTTVRSRRLILCLFLGAALVGLAGVLKTFAADEKTEQVASGGEMLFNGKDLSGWKVSDGDIEKLYKVVSKVQLDRADAKKLVGTGEGGTPDAILFRTPTEPNSDIYTDKEFGDVELHIEWMIPKGSNSGVYLMGQYECQILDTYGKSDDKLGPGDCGGIYHTKAPSTNAMNPPGAWQTYDIVFRAPRFESSGKKVENARYVSVVFNGKKIHENVEPKGPTGSGLAGGEKARGPLMLQGDHGIVAFRNIRIKPVDLK